MLNKQFSTENYLVLIFVIMQDTPPVTQITSDAFAAVKIPEFKNLMLGRFTFIMALRMMSTLVGWWIYLLTNDPLAIGIVGLSEFLPAFGFALYAGHVIDKSEKRKLMLKGVFFYTLAALVLLFFSTNYISHHFNGHIIAVGIYAIIFCTGITRSFTGPTFSAMLASIVPRQILQNATTWNQATWLSASVTGHATGGFLIWKFGVNGTLIIICCLLVLAFFLLRQLKPKPPMEQIGEIKTWESVKEGLRFVFKTKEILGAFTLDMFAVLFGGAVAMVPVYARDILKIGPQGFGWLNASADTK